MSTGRFAPAALLVLLAAGCTSAETAACEDLTEGFVRLDDRCRTFVPAIRSPEDAAERLFGARDACERVEEGAFRDVEALANECVPGLEDVECVAEPVLPAACENQILVEF
jgi:hypothetical protein